MMRMESPCCDRLRSPPREAFDPERRQVTPMTCAEAAGQTEWKELPASGEKGNTKGANISSCIMNGCRPKRKKSINPTVKSYSLALDTMRDFPHEHLL